MNMQQMMMDAAVQTSIAMTAKIMGMTPEAVTKVLQVGMPAMAKVATENPEVLKEMYATSFKMMPTEVQDFYKNLAEDAAAQSVTTDQYQKMFGEMTESINRVAGDAAGVDSDTAGKVLGMTLPGAATSLAAKDEDEAGFGKRMSGLFS